MRSSVGTPRSSSRPRTSSGACPGEELETAQAEGRAEDERWHVRKDGSRFWASGVVTPLYDERGPPPRLRQGDARPHRAEAHGRRAGRLRGPVPQHRRPVPRADLAVRRPRAFTTTSTGPGTTSAAAAATQEIGDGLGWAEGIHPDDRRGLPADVLGGLRAPRGVRGRRSASVATTAGTAGSPTGASPTTTRRGGSWATSGRAWTSPSGSSWRRRCGSSGSWPRRRRCTRPG